MGFAARLERIERELAKIMPLRTNQDWSLSVSGTNAGDRLCSQFDRFLEPGRELLNLGGKRWRPLILVLCCEAAGGGDRGYSLTPLVEIPHNGSLIIDDIEDDSSERRGAPAAHIKFGADVAINTGNLMYFLPTIVVEQNDFTEQEKLSIYSGYMEDLRRLHLGQGLDILWHNNPYMIPEEEEYLLMCRFKTGSLSRMAARLGAIAAGRDNSFAGKAAAVWEEAGAGFQIVDDVINLTTGNPGKKRGDDITEGKKSLPVIYHCSAGSGERKQLLDILNLAVNEKTKLNNDVIKEAIDLMEKTGSIEKAERKGISILKNCINELKNLFGESEAAILQTAIIESFMIKPGQIKRT